MKSFSLIPCPAMSERQIPSSDHKPAPQPDIMNVHTLSMHVANKPGVLGRICAVFSRRGFNIDSLVVSQGRDPRYSRMTVGISGHPEGLHQIILQCNKLIDVIHCFEHTDKDSVVKEMVLVKLRLPRRAARRFCKSWSTSTARPWTSRSSP